MKKSKEKFQIVKTQEGGRSKKDQKGDKLYLYNTRPPSQRQWLGFGFKFLNRMLEIVGAEVV